MALRNERSLVAALVLLRARVQAAATPLFSLTASTVSGGTTTRIERADDAASVGDSVGYVYARVETIFGTEEDERILNGRCRVY